MSRSMQSNGAGPRRPGDKEDICPVCKSTRYLNPEMRFLVNPECYHKMCESCVDRIFSQGPAACPIAGCARTLRKQRFRQQTFEDLKIEREVDIRRRVATAFNCQESDFETLLAYNNYLEDMEVATFNLLQGIDVDATERKLAAFAAQNASSISANNAKATETRTAQHAHSAAQKEQARLNRAGATRADLASMAERDEAHRETIDAVANAKDEPGQKVVLLKKSTARRTAAEKARDKQRQQQQQQQQQPTDTDHEIYKIQGLKPVMQPPPEKAYDPFGGMAHTPAYYTLQSHYEHPWLDRARTDPGIVAGGYDLKEYYQRTMLAAFAGLGCFIDEEMGEKEKEKGRGEGDDKMVATEGAAMAAAAAAAGADQA
ncbi:MAG: hypothetical protein LQ339_003644 [Xanthoria mediterranea]|nr:MAG: hypothetical protein LQ339_003644 [Xanthoria mediterranea]